MILTVTLNPSVDISYKLEQFKLDAVNRVADVSKTAGGKGLNVTRVLHQLGEEVAATGFLGGNLGDFIRKEISNIGVQDHFVKSAGDTRNCIAVIHEGQQTELLEGGPEITTNEATAFLENFRLSVEEADVVTISGSLPKGIGPDFYSKLLEITEAGDKPVLLDTSGESLRLSVLAEHKPYMIKPNLEELAGLFDMEINTEDEIIKALHDPLFKGIAWVVVTLGAEGALIKHGNQIYRANIPSVKAVNPVGSGDSVVAGFAAGLSRELDKEDLMKFGLGMGVLNAMEERTGSINPENIDWCIEKISVKKI